MIAPVQPLLPLAQVLSDPDFVKDCREIFQCPAGIRVLAKLIEHRSPFDQRFIPDLRVQDHIRGAQELVGVLVAHAKFYTPYTIEKPTPTNEHGQTN